MLQFFLNTSVVVVQVGNLAQNNIHWYGWMLFSIIDMTMKLYSHALGIFFKQKMLRNSQHFAHYLQDAQVERYNLSWRWFC
jgi:hypothetical protein